MIVEKEEKEEVSVREGRTGEKEWEVVEVGKGGGERLGLGGRRKSWRRRRRKWRCWGGVGR